MNKTISALLIKFIGTFIITWYSLSFFGYSSFGYILVVSIAVTLFGYYLVDEFLFPRFGNFSASIMDAVFAVITAYFIGLVIDGLNATYMSFILYGLLLTTAEYFFHRYLMNNDEETKSSEVRSVEPSYNMEVSDEFDSNDNEESKKYDDFESMMMEASNEFINNTKKRTNEDISDKENEIDEE